MTGLPGEGADETGDGVSTWDIYRLYLGVWCPWLSYERVPQPN
jgi:hypothetical protein